MKFKIFAIVWSSGILGYFLAKESMLAVLSMTFLCLSLYLFQGKR